MTEEIWKDWPEHPDRYEVSNTGKVRNKSFLKCSVNKGGPYSFMTKTKELAQLLNDQGYMQLRLMVDGVKFTRKVHRMVAETFLDNPDNLPVVNHLNSNRSDNRAENLEWCTVQQNIQHSYDSGSNSNLGVLHPMAMFNEQIVLDIKLLGMKGYRPIDVANELDLEYHKVQKVLIRKNWKHIEPEGSGWLDGIFIGDLSEKDLQLEACDSC